MTGLPSCSMFPVSGTIGAPLAWRDLLKRRPDLSSAKTNPSVVTMTTEKFLQLSQIQIGVNSRIRYRRDLRDKWEVAKTTGDCEDFALAKLVRAQDLGWPRGALRMTICAIVGALRFQFHAVLLVDTDHGTWVLDNRYRFTCRWDRLTYRWLWREKPGSEEWERYDDPLKKELNQ